jgi:hypothetical protein
MNPPKSFSNQIRKPTNFSFQRDFYIKKITETILSQQYNTDIIILISMCSTLADVLVVLLYFLLLIVLLRSLLNLKICS